MKKYSEEFRQECVRLALEAGRPVKEVARELGLNVWTLREWVQKHRQQQKGETPPVAETLEQEVRRLRREVAMLRQEREILKKAAAYFAKEQL